MMPDCTEILAFLKDFAPLELAEEWDNVGLLLGEADRSVSSVMTCLTLTPDVAAEAIENQVDLVVSHHPILFRPRQQITNESSEGAMILSLIRHGIAVYSPHTAFDSAARGINQQWCHRLELQGTAPLEQMPDSDLAEQGLGAGRYGQLSRPTTLRELLEQIKTRWKLSGLQYVGEPTQQVHKVAIACGSAAQFMRQAAEFDCQVLITGEARFHACLEARQRQIALVLVGHYASERFACEQLAEEIRSAFPQLTCRPSEVEQDPLDWF